MKIETPPFQHKVSWWLNVFVFGIVMNKYKNATSTSYAKKGLIVTVILLLLGSGIIGLFLIRDSSEMISLSLSPAIKASFNL